MTPIPDIVEAVARAIFDSNEAIAWEDAHEDQPGTPNQRDYRIMAAAAIAAHEAALREAGFVIAPMEATNDMVDAGRNVGPDAPYGANETSERWRAMIAALGE